jgi:short-subunit dehydrogenase
MHPGRDLALVTGASSGIGAELARQLAARRIDLVLTARRRDRLAMLASELGAQHGVTAAVIENDLNTSGGADHLLDELVARGLAPSILINNAGLGFYGPLVEQRQDEIDAMLQVNVRAVTLLCRRLGEAMARARHGYILNMASFAALAPVPRYAVYSAAKAYIVTLTQALRHELAGRGVKVSVLCPGFTPTEFHEVSRHPMTPLMRATQLTPQHIARAGLRGLERGKLLIVPGWWYKLNALGVRLLPRAVMSAGASNLVK